tara:strand:+ start:12733 stop:12951 length:219 start_codon:yes stop_codon:yes gene_type:complete
MTKENLMNDLRSMKDAEITDKINNLRKELFELRFQQATRQLTETHKFQQSKKQLAQLLTVQQERLATENSSN